MIVSSMVFMVAVSVVASAAALLLEAGLCRMGVATRFAWLGALALGPALLAARVAGDLGVPAPGAPPFWGLSVRLPTLQAGTAAAEGFAVEGAAAMVWLLSGLGLATLVARTHQALLTERSGWESTRVMRRDVFVSTDRGPAVAGVRWPWIVLPRWVLALPERELHMVLLHEEEHLRAGDTRLLAAALALVTLSAWSPVTWWQLRRLRAAMEMDCDRRVLRQAPDAATYGASLISVAARASGPSLGLAAFTERSFNLKRRILAMTAKTSRWTALGGGVLVVVGTVVGLQACGVDTPVGSASDAKLAPAAAAASSAEPTFTPFTVAPDLVNHEEVGRTLEREYPPLLRDAGVGGTVSVYVYIDEEGRTGDARINTSSGHAALDEAALRVARSFRFSPARDGEKPIPVWVSLPITFAVR